MVWGTFCDWYLELIKPVLMGEDGPAKDETRKTAVWVFDQILTLLHPFMPFVTEELWHAFERKRDTDLILGAWPTGLDGLIDADATAELDWLIRLVTEIRSVRSEMNVPPGAKIHLHAHNYPEDIPSLLTRYVEIICRVARVEKVSVRGDRVSLGSVVIDDEYKMDLYDLLAVPSGSIQFTIDGAEYFFPAEGVIDIAQERARLQKNLEKIEKEIKSIEGRLSNEKFMAKAPAAVVDENRARKADAEETVAKLTAALARLKAAG